MQGEDLALQDAARVQAGEVGQVLGSHHCVLAALPHQNSLQLRPCLGLPLRQGARHLEAPRTAWDTAANHPIWKGGG